MSKRFLCSFIMMGLFTISIAQDLKVLSSRIGYDIYEGNMPVLTYRVVSDSSHVPYDRPHYIHPLYSMEGEVITEDVPEDHPHHHGLFTAWHQVIVGEKQIGDSWVCDNVNWEVVETNIEELDDRVVLSSVVQWSSRLDHSEVSVVSEEMDLTIWKSTDHYRIIDADFTLQALVDQLKLGGSDDEKGYGGFNLRLKKPEELEFFSGKKIMPENTAVRALPWMDMRMNDGESGVLVMVHPSNPGPTDQWILRNSKSMQNPVFPGRDPVDIDEEGVKLKYRIIVYSNSMEEDVIDELYEAYVKK